MKKVFSLIMLSLILILAGCGKNVSDQPEPVIEDEQDDPVIDDEQDDTVKYQLILDYGFESKKTSYAEGDKVKVYYDLIATDTDYSFYTDSDDVELKRDYDDKKGFVITFIMPAHDVSLHVDSVNSMEYIPETEFNYDEVDTKGLSEETLDLFATCAIYLETGSNTDNGDMLSSKELYEIEEFLICFINSDNENVEFMHDYNGGADIPTKQWRIKYEDWECLLREVLNEKNPQNLRDKMSTEFAGEMEVYYNPDDNYIYMEVGAIGWGYEYAKVREVKTEGNTYVITYDLYSDLSPVYAPYSTVDLTIAESDNKYGYSLVSVEETKDNDAEKIREILAAKYSCNESPFYTVFDHIDEDGIYVYHLYELVIDETGSHCATIDWIYVNPVTGEATTFFDEEFNISDYEF